MILTFKIALTDWHAVLEVDSSTTLDELHLAIQEAVQFDDDHMYEFFIARTIEKSRQEALRYGRWRFGYNPHS